MNLGAPEEEIPSQHEAESREVPGRQADMCLPPSISGPKAGTWAS